MYKKLLPNILVAFTMLLMFSIQSAIAQNIAINSTGTTANSSAILDVNDANKGILIPQVSLSSLTDGATITTPATSLLVYNTNAALTGGVGYFYNSGTSASPVWVKILSSASTLSQSSTSYFNTGAITLNTTGALVYATGYPVTITVPSGCTVILSGDIGIQTTSAAAGGNSGVDVVLVVDGALTTDAGYQRITAQNNSGVSGVFEYASMSQAFVLTAGSHTVGLAGAKAFGSNATFGGDGTSVLQGELTVTIIKN